MIKICEDIHTKFVQFAEQKKTAKSVLRIETDPS